MKTEENDDVNNSDDNARVQLYILLRIASHMDTVYYSDIDAELVLV